MLLNDIERLDYIKKEFSEMRRLYSIDEWQKGDMYLYIINDNIHFKTLNSGRYHSSSPAISGTVEVK